MCRKTILFMFAVALVSFAVSLTLPNPAFASGWVSCNSVGYPNCTAQAWCDGTWENCSIVVDARCEELCPQTHPYGGFDDGSQDCPNASTRGTCCAAKRAECDQWCEDTYNTAGDEDNCKYSVCHAEYSSCLNDGYFTGF